MKQILSNKEKYVQFCNANKSVPLFLQPCWMNAVCKKKDWWEVFLFEENREIKGVFVCYFTKKMGMKFIIQPMLSQYNGIWLKYDDQMNHNEKLHFEKKAITELIMQLNKSGFDYLNQNFPLNFQNWLPFYWQGYRQTTRYSYQISDISAPEACFYNFSYAKQKQILKAGKTLQVTFDMSGKDFYKHLSDYYRAKNEKVTYSESFFLNLYEACVNKNQGEIIAVKDLDGTVHAALFVVWDNEKAYNLISTMHPTYKSSGASSLVVYEAIKKLSQVVSVFDFEGSMAQNIENSFSQFGTEQISYFNIKKYNSRLAKTVLPHIKL